MASSLSSLKPWSRILESQGPVIAPFFPTPAFKLCQDSTLGFCLKYSLALFLFCCQFYHSSPRSSTDTGLLCQVSGCKAERNTGPAVLVLVSTFAGWRDGSAVKSSYCSHRGPNFGSQHLPGISKPPITLVPQDVTFPCLYGSAQKLTQAPPPPHTHTDAHIWTVNK